MGDDDQSIYGFRGADPRNMMDLERDFPETVVIKMEENYRCTERILDVANAVVARNEDRIDKALRTETKQGGKEVTFLVYEHPQDEAAGVADALWKLNRIGGVPWSDMAVIYRTNATSQLFERAMMDRGVPVKVVGGRPFHGRREVRDALAYLRLILHPADDSSFLRIVNVPTRGIGTATLTKIREAAAQRGQPLLPTAQSMAGGNDRASKAIASFTELIERLTELAKSAQLPVFVHEVLEQSGYLQMLQEEDDREARERLESLQQLLASAQQYDPTEDDPLALNDPLEMLQGWLDRMQLAGSDEELRRVGRSPS